VERMIEGYLNQRAVWKRVVRLNEYGEPETKQKTIKVRWEGKRRLVRDNEGREVAGKAGRYSGARRARVAGHCSFHRSGSGWN